MVRKAAFLINRLAATFRTKERSMFGQREAIRKRSAFDWFDGSTQPDTETAIRKRVQMRERVYTQ